MPRLLPTLRSRFAVTAVLLGGCAVFSVPVSADTITQSVDFVLNDGTLSTALSFAAFAPGLGTLNSIQVEINAIRRQDWGLWNTNPNGAADIAYSASLTRSSWSLGGTTLALPDITYGPASISNPSPVPFGTAVEDYLTNRSLFLVGATPTFASGYLVATTENVLTAFVTIPTSDGLLTLSNDPGQLNVSFGTGDWQFSGPGNVLVQSLTDLRGSATLTYTYTANNVPDSVSTGLMTLLGLGSCLVIGARFGRRRAV